MQPEQARQLLGFGEEEASRTIVKQESRFLRSAQGVAYLEIALIMLLLVGFDYLIGDIDGFAGVNPNPYWIPVILISVQYGVFEGLVAAFLSSVLSVGSRLFGPLLEDALNDGWSVAFDNAIGGDFTSFNSEDYLVAWQYASEPLLWLIVALMVGLLRERLRQRNQQLAQQLRETAEREQVLTEAYEQLLHTKEHLEVRVAGQLKTVFTLYQAAKAIEKLGPGEVLIGIADLVRAVMQPTKFSLYLLNGSVLEAVTNDGWDDDDTYARVFDSSTAVFQEVVGRRHIMSVVNAADERLLAGEGILAGPLTSVDTGEVVGMLKIEKLGFLDLHVSSLENFRILSEWVGTAFANARRFRKAQGNMYFNDDRTLLSDTVYRQHSRFMKVLGENLGIDVAAIQLKAEGLDVMHENRRQALIKALRDVVDQHMSPMVQAFEYKQNGREFALILPTVNAERDGPGVADSIAKAVMHYLQVADVHGVKVSATAKKIHSLPEEQASGASPDTPILRAGRG
jgi:hypothetical protein